MADDDAAAQQLQSAISDVQARLSAKREQLASYQQQEGAGSRLEELRARAGEAQQRVSALEQSAAAAETRLEEFRRQAQAAADELARQAHAIQVIAGRQFEKARAASDKVLTPGALDLSVPEGTIAGHHGVSKERESEASVTTKQVRNLDTVLQLKREREGELALEAQKQFDAFAADKDAQILSLTQRCLTERETLLADIADSHSKILEAQSRMKHGFVEDNQEKQKNLQEVHRQREAEVAIEQGQEKRGPERQPPKEVQLRCAKQRSRTDDQHVTFQQRREQQRDSYSKELKETESLRDKAKTGRAVILMLQKKLKELRQNIGSETATLEKEYKELTTRVAQEKTKQQHYEKENQKLFKTCEDTERKIGAMNSGLSRTSTARISGSTTATPRITDGE
eukprot:Hpha_TRINITY_DN16953_c4_g5::TRINITY_DN16953_c4_g5_i1::g.52618::m.52618